MKNRKRNHLGQFVKSARSEVSFVNLSSYTSPEVKEVATRDWVSYGSDNDYFQYLLDRYNGSATNNASINGISQQIFGKGLSATDANRKPEEYAKMITLLKKDVVRKLCYDLKLMGQCAIQVIYSKDRKSIAKIEHFPIETLRAEKANEKGEIEAYYYYKDWSKIKPSENPMRIPAFGTSNEAIEILYVQPYKAGFYYYSPVDYQGGLQYAELEEEISNYHLNNIQQGLAPSMLINFNNGIPNQEERRLIESKIAQKFSGTSNAGKFILAFNDNKEAAADITPVQLSDAHQQYQFLSEESTKKIMVAHRIVSPFLLGIRDGNGFSSNADEIKNASILMDNTVIRPFQELLIDNFERLLAFNNITLNLYFITLQPLEFTEIDHDIQSKEDIEEETGIQMSKEEPNLTEEEGDRIIDNLEGEIVSDEWEEVDEREYGSEELDVDNWANMLIEEDKSTLSKILVGLKDSITAKKDGFSVLDKSFYKVRYRYFEKSKKRRKTGTSRDFCEKMMSKARQGEVYRLEDIDKASREGVNRELGHDGKPCDLFKYKGGVYCRHAWKEVLYRLKAKTKKSKFLRDYKVTREIPASYTPRPWGHKQAKQAPVDMPNQGAYPTKKKK